MRNPLLLINTIPSRLELLTHIFSWSSTVMIIDIDEYKSCYEMKYYNKRKEIKFKIYIHFNLFLNNLLRIIYNIYFNKLVNLA